MESSSHRYIALGDDGVFDDHFVQIGIDESSVNNNVDNENNHLPVDDKFSVDIKDTSHPIGYFSGSTTDSTVSTSPTDLKQNVFINNDKSSHPICEEQDMPSVTAQFTLPMAYPAQSLNDNSVTVHSINASTAVMGLPVELLQRPDISVVDIARSNQSDSNNILYPIPDRLYNIWHLSRIVRWFCVLDLLVLLLWTIDNSWACLLAGLPIIGFVGCRRFIRAWVLAYVIYLISIIFFRAAWLIYSTELYMYILNPLIILCELYILRVVKVFYSALGTITFSEREILESFDRTSIAVAIAQQS